MTTEETAIIEKLREDINNLRERMNRIEGTTNFKVRGWETAARMTGLCSKTVRARVDSGHFPQPEKYDYMETKTGRRRIPVWSRRQLYGLKEKIKTKAN